MDQQVSEKPVLRVRREEREEDARREEHDGTEELSGSVKWFDPIKGFGFVVPNCGGPDVLLHANVLRNFGQGSVAEGAVVRLRIQVTSRGRQATEVLEITPPVEEEGGDPLGDLEALPLEPARVKWFDKGKGFGFVNVFGRGGDVFVHAEVLRRSGFSELLTGEAVGLRAVEGKRGRMAVQIAAWDTALAEG